MKLIRYEYPQTPAASALNRIFDLSGSSMNRVGSIFDEFFASVPGSNHIAADLYEDEKNYYARFELPGAKKEELDLEIENSVLTLSSIQEGKSETTEKRTSFRRSLSVPEDVDVKHISAALEAGLLTVTMLKAEARKPLQITVK